MGGATLAEEDTGADEEGGALDEDGAPDERGVLEEEFTVELEGGLLEDVGAELLAWLDEGMPDVVTPDTAEDDPRDEDVPSDVDEGGEDDPSPDVPAVRLLELTTDEEDPGPLVFEVPLPLRDDELPATEVEPEPVVPDEPVERELVAPVLDETVEVEGASELLITEDVCPPPDDDESGGAPQTPSTHASYWAQSPSPLQA